MTSETLFWGIIMLWGFTYIIYSHGNTDCLVNQEPYFFMSPKYIKNKLEFGNLMTFCLTLINLLVSPVYYFSLIFMFSARKTVDHFYWKKRGKELEEKLMQEELKNKKKNKLKNKNIKRLN